MGTDLYGYRKKTGRMDTEIFPFPRPLRYFPGSLAPPSDLQAHASVQIRTHPYKSVPHHPLSLLPRFYGLRGCANRKSTRKGLGRGKGCAEGEGERPFLKRSSPSPFACPSFPLGGGKIGFFCGVDLKKVLSHAILKDVPCFGTVFRRAHPIIAQSAERSKCGVSGIPRFARGFRGSAWFEAFSGGASSRRR